MNFEIKGYKLAEHVGRLKKMYLSQKSTISYMVVSVSMAMLGFLKSYITMKYLGFKDVGLVALMQSVMELISMFQLGLLSGGFRMYFVTPESVKIRMNNMLFSYFCILAGILLLGVLSYTAVKGGISMETFFLILGGFIGIFGLARTWLSNLLIAQQRLKELTNLNVISTILSFLFVFLIPFYGLAGSILLLLSQPLFFIAIILWKNPKMLPTAFALDKNIIRKSLKIGFIPFLAGLLLKSQDQVERWGIFNSLGLDDLGKYNLTLIYSSIFILIPSSLHSIFFSKVMLNYKSGNKLRMNSMLKKYGAVLILYAFFAFGITYLLLPIIITNILPKYTVGIPYVWPIMPFLFMQLLSMPLDIKYDVYAKLRMKLISYTAGMAIFSTLVLIIINSKHVDLKYFPIARSISGVCFILLSYGLYFIYYKRRNIIP